jgi:hypothetical protein
MKGEKMPDFSKARKGDPCFSIYGNEPDENGHNEIILGINLLEDMVSTRGGHPARVDGHSLAGSIMPILFHSKPTWTDPPPPKRMVKKYVALVARESGEVEPFLEPHVHNDGRHGHLMRQYDTQHEAGFGSPCFAGKRIILEVEVPED